MPTQPVDFIRAELRELPIAVDNEFTDMFGDEAAVSARFPINSTMRHIWSWRYDEAHRLQRTTAADSGESNREATANPQRRSFDLDR